MGGRRATALAWALVAALMMAAPAAAQGQPAPADPGRAVAALTARLGQLDEELRRLRGRVEELEFRVRRQEAATQGSNSPSVATPAPAGTTLPASPSPRLTPTVTAKPAPGVLGTLPSAEAAPVDPADLPPEAPADPPRVAAIDPDAPPRAVYESGLQLLQQGDYAAAGQAFDGFLRRFPDDALASNAAYWLGESYYIRGDHSQAAATFAQNYKRFGAEGSKAPDNLLKLGMSLVAMGDRERACTTFAELEKRHPNASTPIKQTMARERSAAGCS